MICRGTSLLLIELLKHLNIQNIISVRENSVRDNIHDKKKLFVKSIKGYISYKFLNIFNPYVIINFEIIKVRKAISSKKNEAH